MRKRRTACIFILLSVFFAVLMTEHNFEVLNSGKSTQEVTVYAAENNSTEAANQQTNEKKTEPESGQKINSDTGKTWDGTYSDGSSGQKTENDNDPAQIESELDETTKGQMQALYDYIGKMKIDDELMQDLNPAEYIKTYIKTGQGNLSPQVILKAVTNMLLKEVKSVLSLAISIITISILCALVKNLNGAFNDSQISEIAFYACYAVIIMLLSKSFIIAVSVATDAIKSIVNFMNVLLPVLVAIIGFTGGMVQSAALDPFVLAAVIIIPRIYTTVIIPMILMSFVLEFADNISTKHKITKFCKLFKQIIIWLQGIIVTVFIALLTIRGITSSTMDAVTLKTTKFAVDNFVPIVGKTFSDAISSVAGYGLIIKNAISSIGLIILILIIMYPVIKLLLMAFIYKMSAALIEPVSDSRVTKSLDNAGGSMLLLVSCLLTVSLTFFILIAIMVQAGTYIVGG